MLAMLLMNLCVPAMAEADTRWADAADEIDKYLDAAFESYLDGDASASLARSGGMSSLSRHAAGRSADAASSVPARMA